MRVKVKNAKEVFKKILITENISLKKYAKKIDVNYSTLKKYARGEHLIPLEVFVKLKEKYSKLIFNEQFLEDNWGSVKGGTISARNDPKNLRLSKARSKIIFKKVKLTTNKEFCELYGALLGDGCISRFKDYERKERYVIQISGNKKLDSNYFKYLKNLIESNYGIYVYYYEYKDRNVCVLTIKNKGLCLELNKKFKVPIGLKYEKLTISRKILGLSWDIKKYVLRGLFDTDGCILANKREGYRYPWITISSKSEHFRNLLIKVLRDEGYPAYNTGSDVCVRGITNVRRWFEDIGSSNSRNLLKYEYFLKHKTLPAGLLDGLVG